MRQTSRQGITPALLINSKYVSLFYYKIRIPYFASIRKGLYKVILHFNEYLCISSILFVYLKNPLYVCPVKLTLKHFYYENIINLSERTNFFNY